MGQISSLFVHKVINATSGCASGMDAHRKALFRSVGIDPDAPLDAKVMVPDDAYYGLCERVCQEDVDGASLSVRVGSSMRCDDYGAFGLAWKSAVDLRGSYERAERYGRVLTSVSAYELVQEDGRSFMTLHRAGERRLGLRISNEQTLIAITQISREVCQGPFYPEAVHFKHPAPDNYSAQEAYFGCAVHYGAERDALEISEARLSAPNRLGDASMSEFFDAHMKQELAQFTRRSALGHQVRTQISRSLSGGAPSVAEVAGRMGVSGRTLQRRLAEQGYAFQDLVDETRKDLAERLLRTSDYALAEVAFLTGFAEQSTFTRAFKRWCGQTPAAFRRGEKSA